MLLLPCKSYQLVDLLVLVIVSNQLSLQGPIVLALHRIELLARRLVKRTKTHWLKRHHTKREIVASYTYGG